MNGIKLCYVAGPFSPTKKQRDQRIRSRHLGDEQFDWVCIQENILNASLLGVEVAKLGVLPVIPHSNTALQAFLDVQPYEFWIEATKEQLRRCDAVIFTDDWRESNGAIGEYELAKALSVPMFKDIQDLKLWAEEVL